LTKSRLEAFSDGVLAIVITIMVLEMRAPHGGDLASLKPLIPAFLSYVLSFVYLAVYWNNHHHLLQAVHRVSGKTLWANLYLLFWLSLIPFVTSWMGENHFSPYPVALYGVVLLQAALAYTILEHHLIKSHGKDSTLAQALGRDFKSKLSLVLYLAAIILALRFPLASCALYALVALLWIIPDTRIESKLTS